jgi:TatD DNase family protein
LFINVHTHQQLFDASLELVNAEPGVAEKPKYYSYGLHPWHLSEKDYDEKFMTLRNAVQEPHCIAVGECGLDKLSKAGMDLQLRALGEQVKLANEVGKPLIIHCVKAFNELLNCLNFSENRMPVIVHGFNNNENIARLLNDSGCYFSFGKALLGYDSNAEKALRAVGRRKFFLETDDADISIKYIYHKAAGILGVTEEILQEQLKANFETVFQIRL